MVRKMVGLDKLDDIQKIIWKNFVLRELIWLFKSLVISLLAPMRYLPNNYDEVDFSNVIDSKTYFEKSPSHLNHLVLEKKGHLLDINKTYDFYKNVFNVLSEKFEFEYQ